MAQKNRYEHLKKWYIIIFVFLILIFIFLFFPNDSRSISANQLALRIAKQYINETIISDTKIYHETDNNYCIYLFEYEENLLCIQLEREHFIFWNVSSIVVKNSKQYDSQVTPLEVYWFSKNCVYIYGFCNNENIDSIQVLDDENIFKVSVNDDGFFLLKIPHKLLTNIRINCLDDNSNIIYNWSY